MTRLGRALPAASLLALLPAVAWGQTPSGRTAVSGVEHRQFRIGEDSTRVTIGQTVVPFGLVVPMGRLTLDLGGAYAWSSLEVGRRDRNQVSGFTDTELRGSLTLGRDLAVLTLLVNLPTGLDRVSATDFAVLGAVSSSFLALPVNAYGNGFSATPGLAVAIPAGAWNVGLAGSVRINGRFTPFVDASAGAVSYRPGVEGRIRAGVDRTVGRSRFEAGFTYSTFGNDEYGTGTATPGLYRPGGRWIAEAALTAPVASRAVLTVFGWHFRRSAGDSVGAIVATSERLTAAGGTLRVDLDPRIRLDLGLDARFTSQGGTTGWLGGGEAGLGVAIGGGVSLNPLVRVDLGRLNPDGPGRSIRGVGASVFLRKSF